LADQNTPSTAIPIKVVSVDQTGAFVSPGAVTIADNGNVVQGAIADAAIITDTTGTLNGKLRGLVKWAFERTPASLGSKTSANSLPVVVASDQASIPVAATLGAETTKVIGTVNQGTSPWVSNATLSAETTKVIGTVNQGTSPWVANATLSAETTKVIGTVRNFGNAGAIFDAATAAAVPANGLYIGGSDGTNLRGILTTSAANLTGTTTLGALLAAGPLATWSITHRPAAATKATATKGAGAAGVRHVVTGFSFVLVTVGTAQAAVVNLDVIDGASGGTTRLWSGAFGGIPVNSQVNIVVPSCMLIGTAATALTIEFSAAGATASFSFVNLQGFSVS
jgi:hypothetical protein